MAIESDCLTPGAIYKIHVSEDQLLIEVDFGKSMDLSEEEASLLEILTHNQLELVLSKFWKGEEGRDEHSDFE